jgi:hypothetical protein
MGVKFANYFEMQELVLGYGESVCYLVDDLLNRELIRRDYKFNEPVVRDDSDDDVEEEKFEHNESNEFNTNTTKASETPSKRK